MLGMTASGAGPAESGRLDHEPAMPLEGCGAPQEGRAAVA